MPAYAPTVTTADSPTNFEALMSARRQSFKPTIPATHESTVTSAFAPALASACWQTLEPAYGPTYKSAVSHSLIRFLRRKPLCSREHKDSALLALSLEL